MQFFPHSKTHASTKRPQASFVHRLSNDPYLDWQYLIATMVILIVVYIGIGFIRYEGVLNQLEGSASSDLTNSKSTFSVESLSQTLKIFDDRSAERSRMMAGYSDSADPSL